ncbi:MAG TPA: sodium:solute symporter, partial [Sutterella sp.]|nr:sodium:solute symporter [Sutterella sp.]
ISAAMTMMIGSIPQQDVFQRVMSAKSAKIASAGPIIGGTFYIFFAFVPMFIVVAAVLAMPGIGLELLENNPQGLLPTLIRDYMPMWLRVVFFGAVLSAVMSTASATMLAPTTTFVENVLQNYVKIKGHELIYMRVTLVIFAMAVLFYSLWFEGTAIYDMVAMAYQFPVIGAFWPLVLGLYWKKATSQGVWLSIIFGTITWTILTVTPLADVFPNVLGGFIVAGLSMVIGSLLPNKTNILNRFDEKATHEGYGVKAQRVVVAKN